MRVTTLLRTFLTEYALLTSQRRRKPRGLKSLSDVTVAPVVPTYFQHTAHRMNFIRFPAIALHHPATLWRL